MVDAIIKELELQRSYLNGEVVETIYFGGGTPSLLTTEQLSSTMQAVRSVHTVSTSAEITVEANPDDLSYEKLAGLRNAGVNRLSIGIQSFDDTVLQYFNRAHTAQEAIACVRDARSTGFDNISIDLIYGSPGLDEDSWLRNIRSAMELRPEHVSAYTLTIEERTVFGRKASAGQLTPLAEELVARQFEMLMAEMARDGYVHYEISNFALPGYYSRHNSSYWQQKTYLGVGPSAHSFNGKTRQFNIANNSLYVKAIQEGRVPCELEELSRANIINETIMTRLRTSDGLDMDSLARDFEYDLRSQHQNYLDDLQRSDRIQYNGNRLVLTNKGKLLADKISADLFVSPE